MAHLTAKFRLLYNNEADFERKLESAELLVGQLQQGSSWQVGAEQGASALPPLVGAHYLRSLVEWSWRALTRHDAAADVGGKKSKKGKALAAGPPAQLSQQPARLQPRCWAVLTAALSSSSISASQPLPAALLPAATAALQLVAEAQQQQQQIQPGGSGDELLVQLALLLQLLGCKFASSFRPSIEHAVSAAEAALNGLAAAEECGVHHQAWQPAATAAVQILAAAVGSHPNQRKVWDALVPRLLPLLARAAFPASPSGHSGSRGCSSGSGGSRGLQDSCRQLLESALLHQQHVAALAAAAGAEMAAALAELAGSEDGAATAPAVAAPGGSGDTGSADGSSKEQPQKQQPGSGSAGGYAAQLLDVLQQLAAAEQLPLALLPWLSGCFCTALRQYRRAAETDVELTRQAGRRQQQQQGEEEGSEGAAADGTQGSRHRAAADSSSGSLSVSADFHFWLALLRMLLPRVQQPGEEAGRGAGLAYTASGLAQLAAALRRHQLYRPTQDPAGHQRLLLQRLADAALGLARQDAALAAAALGTLQGVLAVEHRVIQQQLPQLWPLLLRPAAGAAAAEDAVQGDACDAEAAVAASLVAAFAELRQLEVLLLSLVGALSGGAAVDCGTARAVLRSAQMEAALAAAVRQLPSGQVPMLLRLAASAAAQLGGGSGSGGSQLLVVDLLCCCLDNLRVDLTTAVAAASAAAALVTALAPLLLPALPAAAAAAVQAGAADAGGGSRKEKKRRMSSALQGLQDLLPALLRLYRRALTVHAHCAALHPEVAPLAGQQLLPLASVSPSDCSPGTGYFAPLVQQQQQNATADAGGSPPSLAQLLQATASSGDRGLRLALLQAAKQRVRVLHERLQFVTHTCPITLLPEPGAAQKQQQPEQQQEQQRQQEAAHLESELRQLASSVVAAAAAEAAPEAAASSSSASNSMPALQLAAGALLLLQEWAAPGPLQLLLQGCLRGAASSDSDSTAQQRLCRQLLLADDLMEQRQLAALLPPAAAAEAQVALRAALGADVEGGRGDEAPYPQKKRKKGDQGQGDEEARGGGSAGSSPGTFTAALLEQLGRLARGKALKGSSWAAAVEGCSASTAAQAASLGGSSADGSGSSKKRKQQAAASGNSRMAAAASGLVAMQRLAQVLAQLPLQHLQPQAAASMAAVAVGSLLGSVEVGLAQLRAAGSEGTCQELAAQSLSTVAACLAVLARLADDSSGAALGSQHCSLPCVLQAALQAAASFASLAVAGSSTPVQLVAAAESGSRAMQAAVSSHIAALDSSGLRQLAQQLGLQVLQHTGPQQWAAAVLTQGCLAACYAAIASSSSSSRGGLADILCGMPAGSAAEQHNSDVAALVGSTAEQLEAAVATALPAAAAAAASTAGGEAGGGSVRPLLLAASLYRSAALLLRLHCGENAAADALEQRRPSSSAGSTVGGMAASLLAAASLLEQLPDEQPAEQTAGEPPVQALEGQLLAPALLDYLAACCRATGRMRPAASGSHYGSMVAVLLRALARQQAGAAAASPPSRQIIPFAAAFPAAAAAVADARAARGSVAVRPAIIEALQELVAGSSSQQLLLPLRYMEAALPGAAAGSTLALPLCELLLVVLEAASGSRQQRLLGQHGERIASLLTAFISASAYASPAERGELRQQALPSLQQLAAAILAAGEGSAAAAAAPVAAEHGAGQAGMQAGVAAPCAAEVAALGTAVRALESLAARPKLFPLPAVAASSMLASVTALWSAYAEQQELPTAGTAPLPGFHFCLDIAGGAGLFAGCCHLLLAMLRHRQQELRRCLPLVLQAMRALLRFLVAADLSARLQQRLPLALSPASAAQLGAGQAEEQQWRIKCAEVLATVMSELAGLKEAGIGRYCPQLLADYVVLAAAPPSGRSKALLRYSSPAAAAAHGGDSSGAGAAAAATAMAAAAVAEEDVLSGDPLSPEVAAALRRGAYGLYGACSAAEIQFLFASLGSGADGGRRGGAAAAASWRAALAALKADYERHYKYTGKV